MLYSKQNEDLKWKKEALYFRKPNLMDLSPKSSLTSISENKTDPIVLSDRNYPRPNDFLALAFWFEMRDVQ